MWEYPLFFVVDVFVERRNPLDLFLICQYDTHNTMHLFIAPSQGVLRMTDKVRSLKKDILDSLKIMYLSFDVSNSPQQLVLN